MDPKGALRKETEQVLADYLDHSCRGAGPQGRPPSTPAAAALRSVAQVIRQHNHGFFECAQSQLLDRAPEEALTTVATYLMGDGSCNWGRVTVLVVFAGALLESEPPHKRDPAMSRRLTERLCNYLVEEKGAWIQENGGWPAFYHYLKQKQSPPQTDPSSTLCCIVAAAAGFGLVGLALLLAAR